MKKLMLLVFVGMLAFAGTALGNSLSVTGAAAMEGSFGLQVFHLQRQFSIFTHS